MDKCGNILHHQLTNQGSESGTPSTSEEVDPMDENYYGPTGVIALDCEMVGVGRNGGFDLLARVTLVNYYGNIFYDRYVDTGCHIFDYRTDFSGIRSDNIRHGINFFIVQDEVERILGSSLIIVGHDLEHDFQALDLCNNDYPLRDTARVRRFRDLVKGSTPSLKKLARIFLKRSIQRGEHNPAEDARTALDLYKMFQWGSGDEKWRILKPREISRYLMKCHIDALRKV